MNCILYLLLETYNINVELTSQKNSYIERDTGLTVFET